jgi:hypothetical protein
MSIFTDIGAVILILALLIKGFAIDKIDDSYNTFGIAFILMYEVGRSCQ